MASVNLPHTNQIKPQVNQNPNFWGNLAEKAIWWIPRIGIAGYVATYALGWAYVLGVMAAVDRVAMATLMWFGGDVGGIMLVGHYMPLVQQWAPFLVRGAFITVAETLYHLAEKVVIYVYHCVKARSNPQPVQNRPAPLQQIRVV